MSWTPSAPLLSSSEEPLSSLPGEVVLDPAENSFNMHTSTRVLEGAATVVVSQISQVRRRMGGVIAPEKKTVIDLAEQLRPMIVT